MAKPTSLTPDALAVVSPAPTAATSPRGVKTPKATRPVNDTPMQIHVPRSEARAIKIAAAQSDLSISQFMLNCFHAYIKNTNHGNG